MHQVKNPRERGSIYKLFILIIECLLNLKIVIYESTAKKNI